MRVRTCLLLALCTGLFGVVLRGAIPVAPVDQPFRDTVRYYDSLERPTR